MINKKRYENINERSSDDEKIDVVLQALSEHSPDYVRYEELGIEHKKQSLFNAKLVRTGFVEPVDTRNSYNPGYKLSHDGDLMLDEFGSYINYLDAQNKQNQQKILIHTREQELEKENADLDKRLKESQLKINELSLVKKTTWKERHWLLIALGSSLLAGGFGFMLDIGKEAAKRKLWPDTKESKVQIHEKSDTFHIHK